MGEGKAFLKRKGKKLRGINLRVKVKTVITR